MFSMTTGCDGPIPSTSRPSVAAWVDIACCAIAIGCRGYVGITAVPSSMRFVTWPASASAVRPSRLHGMCGTHPVVNPSASAARALASSSSTSVCAPLTSLMKTPMRIGAACHTRTFRRPGRTTPGRTM